MRVIQRAWRYLAAKQDEVRTEHQARRYSKLKFDSPTDLVRAHFEWWSETGHVNKAGFECALAEMRGRPQTIIETGSSAWGVDSTRLWDAYVRAFGGEFWSVDVSIEPRRKLERHMSSTSSLVVGDSVKFLNEFVRSHRGMRVTLCYLDSWDLDWSDPEPSEIHGFREWSAVKPLMGSGSLLIVDDTPGSIDWVPTQHRKEAQDYLNAVGHLPGKGALIERELCGDNQVKKLWHGYNVVYKFL